jgi:hypothetical protein
MQGLSSCSITAQIRLGRRRRYQNINFFGVIVHGSYPIVKNNMQQNNLD